MNKIKKLMISSAATFLTAVVMSGAAFAYSITGTVKVGTYLNIRSSASTSSSIIGKLYNGTSVKILSSSNGWYQISFNGGTGWVSSQYISTQTVTGTVQVGTYLNVRSSASSAASVIGRLYNGQTVTILGNTNGWYQISFNGGTGWVSENYVTVGSSSSQIQTVVNTAKSMLGVPYVFGGASPSGMDCSGLTLYAYGKAGITLPHSAAEQSTMGIAVSRSNLQPGDLIFFDTDGGNNNINHVGIYIGDNQFISAQSGSTMKVNQASLTNPYWSSVYMTAHRLIY